MPKKVKKSNAIEVVINKCYGGFGLSREAVIELYKKKAKGIKAMEPSEYYGNGWKKRLEIDKQKQGDLFSAIIYDDKVLYDEYRYTYEENLRADPDLVKVVKKLGEKANGSFAELKIVEIPADVEWEIDEYDGMETVQESHRSWG